MTTDSKVKTRKPNRGARQAHERGDGRITLHELAIRSLVDGDQRICRNGFNGAVRALVAGNEYADELSLDIRPDAYLIDSAAKELTLYEVGDWRLNTHDKEVRLGEFWFWWDSYEPDWTVRCYALNRFGRMTHEIDLGGCFLDSIAQHSPRFADTLEGRSEARGG